MPTAHWTGARATRTARWPDLTASGVSGAVRWGFWLLAPVCFWWKTLHTRSANGSTVSTRLVIGQVWSANGAVSESFMLLALLDSQPSYSHEPLRKQQPKSCCRHPRARLSPCFKNYRQSC